jgi:hypothetical protein
MAFTPFPRLQDEDLCTKNIGIYLFKLCVTKRQERLEYKSRLGLDELLHFSVNTRIPNMARFDLLFFVLFMCTYIYM